MKQPLRIPFNVDGDLLPYASEYTPYVTWKDNFEFVRVMRAADLVYGNSTNAFILEDIKTKNKYSMFATEMLLVLQNAIIIKGDIFGTWTFRKQGPAYSLKMVLP